MLDDKVCGIRISDVDDGENKDHSVGTYLEVRSFGRSSYMCIQLICLLSDELNVLPGISKSEIYV